MKRGGVYMNGVRAGTLWKTEDGIYVYRYDDLYYKDGTMPAISLTLPKTQQEYRSGELFAFFYGMLAEGINKEVQCRLLKIDEDDDYTRLLKTAGNDTIGAVTVREE